MLTPLKTNARGGGRGNAPATAFALLALAAALTGCTAASSPDELVGAKHPLSEYAVRTTACLAEQGWDTVATFDNGVTPAGAGVPTEDEDAYLDDLAACDRRLGYEASRTPSDEQLREAYERTVDTRQCLIEHGHDIPEPPSESAFIEQFRAGESWEVSSFVPYEDGAAREDLLTACVPPEWFPNW